MSEKKKTPLSVYVTLALISLLVVFIARNRDDPAEIEYAATLARARATVAQMTPPAASTAPAIIKPAVVVPITPAEPVKTEAKPQPKWVQPRILPGVELWYSSPDGTKLSYIGIITDAAGRTIDGERCFGMQMRSGSVEYKHRAILWNGRWWCRRTNLDSARTAFDSF